MQITPLASGDVEVLIVFGLFALGYTAYYTLFHSKNIRDAFHRRLAPVRAEIARNLIYRTVIVMAFGAVPLVLLTGLGLGTLRDYGLAVNWSWPRLGVTVGLSLFVATLIIINPGKRKLTGAYPQMRITEWRASHLVVNTLSWAVYLAAYELMFRGLMLRVLLPYGIYTAVIVNIAIYVAVHVPKGLSEAIGAIPFGLVVCYLTLRFGTVWAAFALHLALALANSYVALRINPDMRVVWRHR